MSTACSFHWPDPPSLSSITHTGAFVPKIDVNFRVKLPRLPNDPDPVVITIVPEWFVLPVESTQFGETPPPEVKAQVGGDPVNLIPTGVAEKLCVAVQVPSCE